MQATRSASPISGGVPSVGGVPAARLMPTVIQRVGMKEQKLLGALLPSSPGFAPIIESVREKYNLHEVDPDSEYI